MADPTPTSVTTNTATYSIEVFNLDKALAGNAVTNVQDASALTTALAACNNNPAGVSGLLVRQPNSLKPPYCVNINGTTYYADEYGTIMGTQTKLKMLVATMNENTAIGASGTLTRGLLPGQSPTVDLSSMEPRDQMAVHALNSMLGKLKHPDAVNDSTIQLYTRAAYRWAQGMVIASSDTRPPEALVNPDTPTPTPTPTAADVTPVTNNDKLLNNIVVELDALTSTTQRTQDDIKNELTGIYNRQGDTNTALGNIKASVDAVKTSIDTLAGKFTIPTVQGGISISATYQIGTNRLTLAFSPMAYSDVTIYVTLTGSVASQAVTRFLTLKIPAGTTTFIYEVDVDTISAITAKTFGGKAWNDPNTYTIQ